MAAHRKPTRPHEPTPADAAPSTPADAVPPVAESPGPVPDGNRLTRRERRRAANQSGRAGKVQPSRGQGLVPNPRQYSTRRRG